LPTRRRHRRRRRRPLRRQHTLPDRVAVRRAGRGLHGGYLPTLGGGFVGSRVLVAKR